jgi:hypothetical protein
MIDRCAGGWVASLAPACHLSACATSASAPVRAQAPSSIAARASTEKHMSDDDSFMPEADRSAPAEVKPVVRDGVRYEALIGGSHDPQVGGLIGAHDVASGRRLWTLAVFDNVRKPEFEGDAQDVFVRELRFDAAGHLQVTDELGRHWVVDVVAHTSKPGASGH